MLSDSLQLELQVAYREVTEPQELAGASASWLQRQRLQCCLDLMAWQARYTCTIATTSYNTYKWHTGDYHFQWLSLGQPAVSGPKPPRFKIITKQSLHCS